MMNGVELKRWFCAVLVMASLAVGCSQKGRQLTPAKDPLVRSNGMWNNGLSMNGMWNNGMWNNGMWNNGLTTNGMWNNGMWNNGMWNNGLWENGMWNNGMWNNGWTGGLWSNATWAPGQAGDAAIAGDILRTNGYARQLLQYIFMCAMPPTTYDSFLDPNDGALSCSSEASCDFGYECSSNGKCVIPLVGGIGLGINRNGSTWPESGECDETCQRWVSACLLARTNAYGVHVQISIRAPADAPQAIKDALAVSTEESEQFQIREGAYYGNIFATTPQDPPPAPVPPATGYTGPTTGKIVSTPTFYACAGPGSNIPQLTQRFCSSQGEQTVIKVPGVCLGTNTQARLCDPPSEPFGAVQDCKTAVGSSADPYKEVLTVYLRQHVAFCGNGVCEEGEEEGEDGACPSDCHPGWARSFSPNIAGTYTDTTATLPVKPQYDLTAVGGPENEIAVAGIATGPVSVGGDVYGAGPVLVAKYSKDGVLLWGARVDVPTSSNPGLHLDQVTGVAVGNDGTVHVVGTATTSIPFVTLKHIWVATFAPTYVPDPETPTPTSQHLVTVATTNITLTPTTGVVIDSQDNLIMGGVYKGDSVFGMSETYQASYFAKISRAGTLVWKWSTQESADDQFPTAVSVDPNDNIITLDPSVALTRWDIRTGTPVQIIPPYGVGGSSGLEIPWRGAHAIAADADGIYLAGNDSGFGAGTPDAGFIVGGLRPILMKFNATSGAPEWQKRIDSICSIFRGCKDGLTDIHYRNIRVNGSEVIVAATGHGPVDFGVGDFLAYTAPNIYVASYSPAIGDMNWAKQVPTYVSSGLLSLAIDGASRVVLGGTFAGSMLVDNRSLVTPTPEDPAVLSSFVASFLTPSSDDHKPPQIVTVAEQTPEAIDTVPHDIFAQATGPDGAEIFYVKPAATDEGNAGTNVSCVPAPNVIFPLGETTVTCTAYDPRGNSGDESTASFTVTVVDTRGPIFAAAPDVTAQAPTASGVAVSYTPPAATDQVDGNRTPSCLPASGSVFPVGSTTVTCEATDVSGNKGKVSFAVNVAAPAAGGPCTGASDCPSGFCVDGVCCASACGGGNANDCQACSVAAGGSANGTCTPIALVRVCRPSAGVCDAVETCDGTSLTCPADTSVPGCGPPVVTVPANMTVEATSPAGAAVTFSPSPSAKDWHGTAIPTVTCTPASGSTFAVGTTTVTCTAIDTGGQTGSASFTVTVKDSKGPVFGSYTDPVIAYATSTSGAKVTYTVPSANDAIDGRSTVSCTPAPGSQFPVNKTTVNCTATDNHGNSTKASFTVWVQYQAPTDGSFFITPRPNGSGIYRIGRPVPVRFKLTGASGGITNLVAKLQVTKISSTVQGTVEDTSDETVEDTDFTFRYRALLNFYVYRWKTRDQTQGTYRLNVVLGDGVTHQVNVSLKP
jgi:hypothetical protein